MMVDGGKFFLQSLRAMVGFIAAMIGVALFLAWGLFAGTSPETDPVETGFILGSGLTAASMLGASVFVPALCLIVLAELASLRGAIYHVGAAGVLAFVMWSFGSGVIGPDVAQSSLRPGTSVAIAAGFVGGFVYWIIAGRASGCWKTKRDA